MGNTLKIKWLGVLLAAVGSTMLPSAQAASQYWDTLDDASGLDAGNGTWNTGSTALWNSSNTGATSPLGVWAANDDAFFQTGGNNVVTLSGTILANSFSNTVNGTNTTLNGGTLQLTGTGTLLTQSGTGTLTINSALTLSNSQTWSGGGATINGTVAASGNTLTITNSTGGTRVTTFNGGGSFGALALAGSNGSGVSVNVNGPGLTITGALSSSSTGVRFYSGANNSFGSISFSGGVIVLGGINTIGSTTLSGGTTVTIQNDANLGGTGSNLTLTSGTLRILDNSLTSFGGRTVTFTTATLDIDSATNTFTMNKVLAGTSSLIKAGKGMVVLNQTNTSTGTYTARGGTLHLDANAGGSVAITSSLAINGGRFLYSGLNGGTSTQTMGAVTVTAGGGTIEVNGGSGTATTLNLGTITATAAGGSLNFVKSGATVPTITTTTTVDGTGIYNGRLTYNGTDWATTSTGQVAAYTGYSALNTAAGIDALNSRITAGGTTTLASGAHITNSLKIENGGTGALDIGSGNSLTLTNGGLLFTGSTNYAVDNGTLSSGTATNSDLIVHQYGAGDLAINSVIANGIGTSTLTKTGSGTLVLSGANTYTGETYINQGVLSVGVLAGTNNNLGAGAQGLNINDGTLRYTGVTASTARTVALGSNGGTFDITSGSAVLTLSGVISDSASAGSLTKTGAGTLLLSGSNTFSGGVYIDQGILQMGGTTALNSRLPNIVNFGSGSTGTLRLNGFNTTVAGLNSNTATPGTTFVENNSASTASTLTVNSTFASTYAGTIRNGSTATLGLIKTGANTFTLSGSSTYTGATTVSAGTLLVSGSLGNTAVTVANGATLGGSGSIGGLVTFQSGSTSSPGESPGKPTYSAGAIYETGSTFKFELIADKDNDNGTRGIDFDGVDVTGGTLTIQSGVSFNIVMNVGTVDYTSSFWDSNQSWLVFDNTNAPSVMAGIFTLGTISTDASLNPFSTTGGAFSFSQTGNDIYLNYTAAVPEPSTYAMLIGGLGLLMVLRRRSTKA